MKLTISIPNQLYNELIKHIEDRFGPGRPRLKSAIITTALHRYLNPDL